MESIEWSCHESILAIVLVLLALGAAQAQVVVGKDYLVLPKPHPVSSGDKIEVAEFFLTHAGIAMLRTQRYRPG